MKIKNAGKERIAYLIIIMTVVSFMVVSLTIGILYNVAFEEEELRLEEAAKSKARLIEVVAKYSPDSQTIELL